MPRALGRLQHQLLAALRRHGRDTTLESLAAQSAGLTPTLDDRLPRQRPSRAVYVAVARALKALERRGLVQTELIGCAKGRIEWQRTVDGKVRPIWLFKHPTTRLRVRLTVDSLSPKM